MLLEAWYRAQLCEAFPALAAQMAGDHKKPPEHLEYVIVHELAHLIEASHGERFVTAIDRFLPKWRHHRQELNEVPVRHEHWNS